AAQRPRDTLPVHQRPRGGERRHRCPPHAHRLRFLPPQPMTRQAILLAVLAGVAACGKPAAGDAKAGDAQRQPVVGARTIVVTTKPFSETINAIGAVSPAPGHVASLAAPAPTRVSGVLVVLGEQVAQGQPLVELDKTTFDAALASAEATVRTATASYDRVSRLAAAGISP